MDSDTTEEYFEIQERERNSALIALHFNLWVGEVSGLVEGLRIKESDPSKLHEPGDRKAATELMGVLADMRGPLLRLRRFVDGHGISLETLSMAIDNDKIDWLTEIREGLLVTAFRPAQACPRNKIADPRTALLVARMATIAQFWFDKTDEWPHGVFLPTSEGIEATPRSGLAFIVEVIAAAGFEYTSEEIQKNIVGMQNAIGMTGYFKWAAEDPELYLDWMQDYGVSRPHPHLTPVQSVNDANRISLNIADHGPDCRCNLFSEQAADVPSK